MMKLANCLGLLGVAVVLGGCASTLESVTNPGMNSDVLNDPGEDSKLRGFKGDRRMVRTHLANSANYEVCRESWADAIGARTGSTNLTIDAKGSIDDELSEELTKTYDRGHVADVTRTTLSWLCDIRMNGWVDDEFVASEFTAIREGAYAAITEEGDSE